MRASLALLRKIVVDKSIADMESATIKSSMSKMDFDILVYFVEHEHETEQSGYSLEACLSALTATLRDGWKVAGFDQWLASQLALLLTIDLPEEVEHTKYLELAHMDDVFEDFATLDTRIQQACKYVVKRVPAAMYLVPRLCREHTFTHAQRTRICKFDDYHFVEYKMMTREYVVHAYNQDPVTLPGPFRGAWVETDDTSLAPVQYDCTGKYILVRNYGPKACTLCDRRGNIIELGFGIEPSCLVVMTKLVMVVMDARQLNVYDMESLSLVDYCQVEHRGSIHHLAASYASLDDGLVAWCSTQGVKTQVFASFGKHAQVLIGESTKQVGAIACCAGQNVHVAYLDDRSVVHVEYLGVASSFEMIEHEPVRNVFVSKVPETTLLSMEDNTVFAYHASKCIEPFKRTRSVYAGPDRDMWLSFIITVKVVHVAGLDAHVLVMGETHTFLTAREKNAMEALFGALLARLDHQDVHIYLETQDDRGRASNYHVVPDEVYLEGGDDPSIEWIKQYFDKTKPMCTMHYFDVRGNGNGVVDFVPEKVHKFLHESKMPDKRKLADFFATQKPQRKALRHYDPLDAKPVDLFADYARYYGPAYIAALNALIMKRFSQINLSEAVKKELVVSKLKRELYSIDQHAHASHVLLTDILMFYSWLAQTTSLVALRSKLSWLYAGDQHVQNFLGLVAYFTKVTNTHVVETNFLDLGALHARQATAIADEWFRQTTIW